MASPAQPPAPSQQTPLVLVTARDFSADAFRLLELNADVERALQTGDKVFIVGAPVDRAVLCTSTQSFYLAKEDTSNLRLLTEHTQWAPSDATHTRARDEIAVRGSATFHYLLQPKTHDIMRLKTLLLEAPFDASTVDSTTTTASDVDDEAARPAKRAKRQANLTTVALVALLQASEHEVLAMLTQLFAFELDNTWRVLQPAYETRVVADMLDALVQHDVDAFAASGVALSHLQTLLPQHPRVAIRQCCKMYGTVDNDTTVDNQSVENAELCQFNPDKIARFCAKQLFAERLDATDSWLLDVFLDKWALRVPDGVRVGVEQLRGVALVRSNKQGVKRVAYFSEDDLPRDAKLRFDALFAAQDKWTLTQLEPYIESLVVPGMTQAALLLKHTRSSRQINSNERLYSRR